VAFASLRLAPPTAGPLCRPLPALGRRGAPASLIDGWPGLWAFTARGWQPVQREQVHPTTEVARCELSLTRVTQIVAALLSVVPQPPKDPDGTGAAYFRVGERGLLVVKDTTVPADQLLQVFRFGDGSAGAVVASVGSEGNPNGYCGAGLIVTLELVRLAGPPRRTSLGYVDGCRGFGELNGVRVEGFHDDIDEDARAIVSSKRRDSIVVTLPVDGGPKSWEIRWDRTGRLLPP